MTLLGIPGDNTYSNYQEASRAFWRQTVLPLVGRTTRALSEWLGGGVLELRADLDDVEALSPEREALWARLDKATFLTQNEKRQAAGYGADGAGGDDGGEKFNPYHDEDGRFTDAENAVEPQGRRPRPRDNPFGVTPDGTPVDPAASRPRGGPPKAPTPPSSQPPKAGDPQPQYKTPRSGQSGKEGAKDVLSWANGERPLVGENGDAFAKRLLDQKYGEGNYKTGSNSEFSQIKKYGDRHFD